MVHQTLKGCRITVIGQLPSEWSKQDTKRWVEQASGVLSQSINDETTHVVISEHDWKKKGPAVRGVFERKANGQHIYVVKSQWLEDCILKKGKFSENKLMYSWEKDEEQALARSKKEMKEQARLDKATEPKNTPGLMSQVFTESTEQFVSEQDRKRLKEQRTAEMLARKEDEAARKREFENQRDDLRVKETAAVFRRGAQKARNELLSDNHHIYTDSTGFTYDVLLTKVDTKNNRNERYALTLQIYESNGNPATYAFNCQFAGTQIQPKNNIIAAIGSNFHTAFHAFKKVFKEKTHIEWENRIIAAVERGRQHKRSRLQNHSIRTDSQPSQPVDDEIFHHGQDENFKDVPFEYQPPLYGPRGELPTPTKQNSIVNTEQTDYGPNISEDRSADLWTKGVHNSSPQHSLNRSSPAPARLVQQDAVHAEIDALMEKHDYDTLFQQFNENGQLHDGLDATSFEEPFDFGHMEDLNESNRGHFDEQIFPDRELLNHTQTAKQARGPLMELIEQEKETFAEVEETQDDTWVTNSAPGKRKQPYSDDHAIFEDGLASKKPRVEAPPEKPESLPPDLI